MQISTGCADLAREKIMSIFHHVANKHVFKAFKFFKKCLHKEITEEKPWVDEGKFSICCQI